MSLKEQLLNILEQHNHPSDKLDDVLFQLLPPYCLHKTLAQGSPFLENNNGLSEAYVAECTGIAENMFRRLNFSSALLVVYEDCYSENIQDDICFVENCLKGIGKTDVYTFPWKFRPMEETCPAALANNSDVYTCTRRLYETKEIDVQQLFREIILSDIGGKYDLDSKIFIIDTDTGCIFHLYDDRGLWVSAPERDLLPAVGYEV